MLEKTLKGPLDSEEIKPVNPKGNQSSIFFGRTDAEVKLHYFGHLMRGADSLKKTLMLGKLRTEAEGGYRVEMVRYHTNSMEPEFGKTLGDSGAQGILGCCSPWNGKELDVT